MIDDFAVDVDGIAYVAQGTRNVVTRITPDGKATVIAGGLNGTDIANPTSVQFGRTEGKRRTIYVTTAGGLEAPINGTVVTGAQLVSINIPY